MHVGDIIEGKYELRRLMGEGGMGAIFEVWHTRIGRRLALKTLHPHLATNKEMVQRFILEAQAAAGIGSEYIIDITDAGETTKGIPFLVMELLEGQDLSQLIREQAPLEPVQAAYLIRQVCLGVGAAHERGIIHRDLKPQNIYITRRTDGSPWVKVLDFGIAKFRAALAEEIPELTTSGTVMGTPYYMAPEQARGAKNIDHKADIYSVGVILFEMLTADRPFDGSNYNELIVNVATKEPKSIHALRPGLEDGLIEAVRGAMARDRDSRFQTMTELNKALEPFAGQQDAPQLVLNLSGAPGTRTRNDVPKTTIQPTGTAAPKQLPPTLAGLDIQREKRPRSRMMLVIVGMLVLLCSAAGIVLLISSFEHDDLERGEISAPLLVSEPVSTEDPEAAPASGDGTESLAADSAVNRTTTGAAESAEPQKTASLSPHLSPEPPRRSATLAPEDRGFVDHSKRRGMEWGNRCFLHLGDKRHDAARAACYRGLEIAEEPFILGALYYNLGRVEENEGRIESARWYYRKSLVIRPDNPSVAKRLELISAP